MINMLSVIKNKGKIINAYQLGSKHPVIENLISCGKILDLKNGQYEIYSQEAINGEKRGEIAQVGDWIKIDSKGFPYPNDKKFFEKNHRHLDGDRFEQIPKKLYAWDAEFNFVGREEFRRTYSVISDMK